MGYGIIAEPKCSSRGGINSRCRRFCLLLLAVLAQSVATMTVVVAAHVVAVPTGCWRPIDRDRRLRAFSTGRSLVHSADTCAGLGFRDSFFVFFAYTKLLGRTTMRTCERKARHSIRTVCYISRTRPSKTCDLQFANCGREM